MNQTDASVVASSFYGMLSLFELICQFCKQNPMQPLDLDQCVRVCVFSITFLPFVSLLTIALKQIPYDSDNMFVHFVSQPSFIHSKNAITHNLLCFAVIVRRSSILSVRSFICLVRFVCFVCEHSIFWMAFFAFNFDAFRSSSRKIKHSNTFCARPKSFDTHCVWLQNGVEQRQRCHTMPEEKRRTFLLSFSKRLPTVYSNILLTLVVWDLNIECINFFSSNSWLDCCFSSAANRNKTTTATKKSRLLVNGWRLNKICLL